MDLGAKRRPGAKKRRGTLMLSCLSCTSREEEEEAVVELDLSHCSLDDVPADIFALERTLEVLRLASNGVRDLPR